MSLIHGSVWVILLVVTVAASPVVATEGASAIARPDAVQPGDSVTLVFTTPTPTFVDADVADSVTCTLRAPDASVVPCGRADQLVTLEVSPSSRSYTMDVMAPLAPGKYVAHFERKALISVPSADASADATLVVLAPDDGLDSNGAPGTVVPTGPLPGGGPLGALGDSDAARWLASLTLGTAALVSGVVLARPPGGGRP